MISRINIGAKPAGAVYYNENKVENGQARFLGGFNSVSFSRDHLNLQHKINVLERYTAANPAIRKPTFHVSLAFHPSEKLSDERLNQISTDYMERMGFGNQPYLVYRHEDTHHPHVHIVSVSVDANGKAIPDSHQKRRSNTARQAIEKEYGLVEAQKQGKTVLMDGLLPEQILSFKEPEAKKAIGNVVRTAMTDYHFTNLMSFAAFLHQHKIQLNLHQGQTPAGTAYRGLSFQLTNGDTDRRGTAIGPAIKASSFGFAPTLDRLESTFKRNTHQVRAGKSATLTRIHAALAGYSKLTEADFNAQLRTHGIQVIDTGQQYVYVDHKSRHVFAENELGPLYARAIQQSAFSVHSSPMPVVQPPDPAIRTAAQPGPTTQTEQGTPADLASRIEKRVAPVKLVTDPTAELSASEIMALRHRVSQHYQQIRTTGADGQPAPFFESQLIRAFPVGLLTRRLIQEGVNGPDAQKAVAQFETYKQGQLPEIRAKEQAYFDQTATRLTRLAETMPLASSSKAAFLTSMGLAITDRAIVHRQDATLQLPLTPAQQSRLRTDEGGSLAFGQKASKHERSLYLAIAGGQDAPAGVSFYQVSASHLRASVGAYRFKQVAPSLNLHYLNQVTPRIDGTKPLLAQLLERGLVVDRRADQTVRIGHHLTDRDQFVPLPPALAHRLSGVGLPTLDQQRADLQSVVGRNLVSLQQALDLQATQKIHLLVAHYGRQLAKTYPGAPGTMPVPTADSMRAQLAERLAKQIELATQSTQQSPQTPPVKPASTPQRQTAQTDQTAQTSRYAERVVNLLLQAALTPLERGQLATQLGLRWQVEARGSVRLVEAQNGPTPGAGYSLRPDQQAGFSPPDPARKPTLLTSETDRLLVRNYLSGRPLEASGIQPGQLARLNLPVLEKLLPKAGQAPLHEWYHGQRGAQIIVDTAAQHGDAATARRYLTSLYQRGFLVEQTAGETGQPAQYRMGHYRADRNTYVPVPALLAAKLAAGLVAENKGAVLLIEPAWPAPDSLQARHMNRLANQLDSDRGGEGVARQQALIYRQYPGLSRLEKPRPLLDALASQIPQRLASEPTLGRTLASMSRAEKAAPSGTQSSDTQLDRLLDSLNHQATNGNFKGFLDVLGDSGTMDKPKKRRVGSDDRHRPRLR